jgi:hypothetical protein
MSEVWYLFDPQHPRRAAQVLQRLQVEDATLVVEQGTFAKWEGVERQTLSSPRAARSALAARLTDARARGLVSETDDVVVISRLSARHVELEAAMAAVAELDSPDGCELLQIYADYLQSEGDPRGMLASLQLRNLDAREWLAEHLAWCFGRFAPLVQIKNKKKQVISVRWFGGWVTELWVHATRGRRAEAPTLASLLRLPVCAGLRRLSAPALRLPEASELPCRASLRWLAIDGSPRGALTLGSLPRLEHLMLDRCPRVLDVVAPNLRSLELRDVESRWVVEFLDNYSGGPIVRLACETREADHNEADLRALLEHPALGSLSELSLSRKGEYRWLRESWLRVLCEAPLLHRLELRDFSGLGVSNRPEQRERLLAAFASAPGKTHVRAARS